MKQIKILHLLPGVGTGGIPSVVLNHYKNMDKSMFRFDFAVFIPASEERTEEVENMGAKVYTLPRKTEGFSVYAKELTKIITEGGYDIVHAHQSYQSYIPLYYAKKCGIKSRIAHAHSTNIDRINIPKRILKAISHLINPFIVTEYLACGKKAGDSMFGKRKFHLLKNAIKIDNFRFSEEKRNEIRKNMNWQNKVVIANIGRLSVEKNQSFLVEVFKEVSKLEKNAVLCFCGDGEKYDEIKEKSKELGIEDKVFLLGNRTDVNELINAFDCFALPSLFEGIPVTGIEALCNGLPTVMADTITNEFDEYKKIKFISLDTPKEIWAKEILKKASEGHDVSMADKMKKCGYDISNSAKKLEEFYKKSLGI